MTEERQRRMLAAYRDAVEPSAKDRDRVRRGIAIAEGRAPLTPLRRTVIVAVLAAAATLVLAIAWSTLRSDAVLGRVTPDKMQAPHGSDARPERAIHLEPAPTPAIDRGATMPATLPARDAQPVAPVTAPPIQRTPTATRPTSSPPAAPSEAEIVRRIVAALDRDAFADVLRLAAEHHAAFADGTLGPEVRALRILALCELGRDREGRAEATLFLRDHPRAPYRDRIERACDLASAPR